MTKKIKKEPDAIDKVVDYFLENIDNPQDLFKGNTIFQEFTKKLTERMLNTEIKDYLETDENHNKRNGNTQKTIITKNGSIAIDVPRDRNSTFEPVIIPKRQRRFDNFDQKVISLYARGMTISDIKAQLQEFYHGAEISESLISQITDDVIEEVKMWQTKPLEKIYPIVYFDCIVVKVKQDKRIINKAVYLALGINLDGLKDILGMWISENEGAKFWLNNLTEMKNRGLQDILVACSDNLTGMSDAIEAVFPKTQHQLCIVHQIRNSLKFVPYKDRKLVANDLKSIYTAINEEIALIALDHFSEKWNKKYPQITKSWKNNWNNLIIFLEYPQEFRRIIYTTNAIESVNSQLRKVIKNKKIFPNDASVFKIFYLAFQNMVKKWTMPIQNWGSAISHLMIKFEDRVNLS
ncbi:IS256 family transposase [Spiroplasma endosymbiont of Clivina fossor]|uniref:IS256 family transposase n=1 Tax=Spiroplasma endosymbiont of Clivina fossor TaxID=3066282 RepID=UPI00313D13C8